jgi:hypothetical protein
LPAGGAGAVAANRAGAGVANRPAAANRPAPGSGAVGQNRTNRTENRQQNRQQLQENRPSRVENRQQIQEDRGQRRDEIRNQVEENYPRLDFWSDHPNWAAWRINHPYRWATWGAAAAWTGYGGEASGYDYGSDVYYDDGSVYSGGEVVATEQEYAEQAAAIVESAPEIPAEQAEWLPLGVFALTPDGQASGPDPSLFLQIAISKEGVLSGTLHNTETDTTQTIEGMTDKESQRCAWNVVDKPGTIMETGLVNLTKDTGPALIHFDSGETQQWLMVRLPDKDATPGAETPQ